MSARRSKTENTSGLRALIDELYARLNRSGAVQEATRYSVVLRPGDTSGAPNVYTSWASLYAATSAIQGGVRVNFDDSLAPIHMPAGTYDVDGWVWVAGSGFPDLIIDDGAHATFRNLFIDGLEVTYNGTSDFFAPTAAFGEANLYILDGAILTCTAAGRFLVASGAGSDVFITTYPSCGIGDGTHAVFAATGGGTCETFQSGGQFADNAQVGGTLDYDMSVFVDAANQFSNGVGLIPLDQTPVVLFKPGTTGNGPTVFSTWASLYAACFGSVGGGVRSTGVTVIVDDTVAAAHMTAGGPYNLDNWTFTGAASFVNNRATATLIIDDGATMDGSASRTLNLQEIEFLYTSAADFCVVAAGAEFNLNLFGSRIACGGAGAFLEVTTTGGGGFAIAALSNFSELGDGTHAVIDSGAALGFATVDANAGSNVRTGCVTSAIVSFDSSCENGIAAGASYTLIMQDTSSLMSYTPAVLANWSGTAPTSVANALDRIAAKIGPIP